MEKNYTPLNIEALYQQKKESKKGFDSVGNTILLMLATLTVLVISIVLFAIIQKKIKEQAYRWQLLPAAKIVNG